MSETFDLFQQGRERLSKGMAAQATVPLEKAKAREPEKELPLAINRVVWRILLFDVGASLVILMLIPWDETSVNESPFVLAWQSLEPETRKKLLWDNATRFFKQT